jgi:cell division initiation protein
VTHARLAPRGKRTAGVKKSRASAELLPQAERKMRITPLDIRNHGFPRSLSGYARDEVDGFLRMVSEDYEGALREIERLRTEMARLKARVEDLTANEKTLQATLTTAQQLSEDLKRTAIKEAEVLVSQAELKGEKILDAAHRRAARLAEDIREMRLMRTRLAAAVRRSIESHLGMLEGLEAEGEAEGDAQLQEKVAYLSQGPGAPPRGGGNP